MTAPRLTERQRELVAKATETLAQTAAGIAAGMRGTDLNSREDVYRAAYSRTKVRLAGVLAVVGELADAQDANARMVGEVRAVLNGFDWEQDDHQYALEAIERISGGAS